MNKRKFSRVAFNLKAFFNCWDASFKGEVENLGLNGMLVRTDEKLPQPARRLSLSMLQPSPHPLCLSLNSCLPLPAPLWYKPVRPA